MEIYYKQNDVVVRKSYPSDADMLANNLRLSDIEEVWASHNLTPWEAIHLSILESVLSLTITISGKPVGAFGIKPDSYVGNTAMIWFLGSDELDKIRIRFARHSKRFVNLFLGFYGFLYNYVDVNNKMSICWLKFCNAKFREAEPYGIMRKPFQYFYFQKD